MAHKLTAAIRRRWKLLLALLVILMVGLGPYLLSRARSHARRVTIHRSQDDRTTEALSEFRMATFNIAHGRGTTDDNWEEGGQAKSARVAKIAQLIRQWDADVVVLNEVDFCATWSGHENQAATIAEAAGFPYRAEQRNLDFRFIYGSWKFGNAVLSRLPIVDAEVFDLPQLRPWEGWLAGYKRGVVCTLQISPEKQVRLLAVHLEHRSERARVESAHRIVALAQTSDLPLIVAGDFNSTPEGFPSTETTEAGNNAIKVIQESGAFRLLPTASPVEQDMTFSSTQPTQVIDWILIPRAYRFSDYQVIPTELSDHRPVVATIRLNEEG